MRLRLLLLVLCTFVAASSEAMSTSPRAALTPKERAQGYRDVVVLAKPLPAERATVDRAETAEGIHVRNRLPRLGDLRVINVEAGATVAATIARLRATGRYEYVEPDYVMSADATPTDPSFTSQWSLNNTGQLSGSTVGADIRAVAAWDIIHDAKNVVVAIVDGGVRLDHVDIAQNLWRNPAPTFGDVNGASFIDGVAGGNVYDEYGHGTHVAGIICASANNGYGIAGVVWRTQLMVMKNGGADGTSLASDNAACIDYAVAHGANVINCSFGGTQYSRTLFTAIKAARDAGVIVVCSAGNDSVDNDTSPHYPSNYLLDNIVAVGNSGPDDTASASSDYGNLVDLFAPGTSILSLNYTSTTGTISHSGTSMAAPHVTGAIALLKAEFPTDSYVQLINRLLRGVDVKSALAGRAVTNGRLNLWRSLLTTTNRPFNDDFLYRSVITGNNLSIRANNTGATVETAPGNLEPAHAGGGTASLWWEWVAPSTGTVVVDTSGSAIDTGLDLYTGGDVAVLPYLTSIASNDDDGTKQTSRITFTATAGSYYYIAISGKNGATGYVQLNVAVPPANDNFANATPLSGDTAYKVALNTSASLEPGEPQILGQNGDASVWYKWTAPRNGHYQISSFSYDFDALVAVYTGSTLSNLTLVAADDDTDPGQGLANADSRCTINAVSGVTYYIQVETKSAVQRGTVYTTIVDSLWQLSTDGGGITSAPAVGLDGTLYVGANFPDHRLYAIAPNGTLKWAYDVGGSVDTASPAIGADGTIYQGADDGTIVALKPDGTLRWKQNVGGSDTVFLSVSIAIDSNGTLYTHAADGYLYALNPSDGSTKWRYNINASNSYGSAAIGSDGTIYQGSDGDQCLYALKPDGTLKWKYDLGSDTYATPALDGNGNVYIDTYTTSKVISLTPTGTLRWTYAGVGIANGLSSSPTLSADGTTVYVGAGDNKVHAINASTGTARWTYACNYYMYASTPAIDANGVVYIGAYDGVIYAINSTGTLKRTWDTAGIVRSSAAIYGTTLYIGSDDAKLYALDIGASGAGGPWPEYRQNVRRLGRAASDAVAISTAPQSTTLKIGDALDLNAVVRGSDPLAFQWYKNGVAISGATNSSFTIAATSASDAGDYKLIVTGPTGTATSGTATVSFGLTAWLSNLSVRTNMPAGQTLIVGFTVAGGAENVLVRADGPALATVFPQYFPADSVMADPNLAYYPSGASSPSSTDDDWSPALSTTFASVGAFPFVANSKDAAFVQSINGPNNTVWLRGTGGGTVLVEGYALNSTSSPRLTNISARNHVGTDADILIAGFVLKGSGTKRLLIRGIGPGLADVFPQYFSRSAVLGDPKLEIYDASQAKVAENNDWNSGLATTFDSVGAYRFTTGSKDSAIIVNLPANDVGINYTAQVKGNDGGTGEGVIEIYELP